MRDLLLHPLTKRQIDNFVQAPSHALLLIGPPGSGKRTVAVSLAEQILELADNSFVNHPYGLIVGAEPGKAIGIEAVRQLEQFLALKVPGQTAFDRAIIISDAQLLTIEAQNALLKILEEPPAGTILFMTVTHAQAVLPTILSRSQSIAVGRLQRQVLEAHFTGRGYDQEAVAQSYAISGGLPGLMQAILEKIDHPLLEATNTARHLLSQSAYERLLLVDELSKQRALAADVVFILQQMAHISVRSAHGSASKKWQAVLKAGYEAGEALTGSAQAKLTLTHLMLRL